MRDIVRRTVGLQAELIITTAMLVGAALLFGGFLLLRLTEQSLIEQQYKQIRSTIQLVGRSIAPDELSDFKIDPEKIELLLTGIDFNLQGWELYNHSMQSVGRDALSVQSGRRPVLLVQQARLSSSPQLQVDYPLSWLPFIAHSTGSIKAAISLYDVDRLFAGVVFLEFSLIDVHEQISATRQMVLIYVFLYGLVLTGFGVVVLSRNVVRPVNRLSEATASVASGDLDTHVLIDGPREISDLGESFNRMTEALRNGRDELLRSERMASVGHLSAGMAHEIGNPLAAIIGYLEMLKVDINDYGQRDLVCRSLDEASRIDRLVRDLLDYAAPIGVFADPVDPCSIIISTVTSLQSQIVFDGYNLNVLCAEKLQNVCINPHKLTQVLVNLITNARDASEIGATITISATKIAGDVRISVHDQGTGIDADTRVQIFDPFFSTKQEGEGRGLGLTICHRIIDEAGGRIEVTSDAETGTIFTVCLPSIDGI
jgi:signal transduction histidine kinase